MTLLHVRVRSQINCGDVTMLNQKRPSLATMTKSALGNVLAELCIKSRVRNKMIHSLPWITILGHAWRDLPMIFQSLANRLTCDPKIFIHGNSCIILICYMEVQRTWLNINKFHHNYHHHQHHHHHHHHHHRQIGSVKLSHCYILRGACVGCIVILSKVVNVFTGKGRLLFVPVLCIRLCVYINNDKVTD